MMERRFLLTPYIILRELMHLANAQEGQFVMAYDIAADGMKSRARLDGKQVLLKPWPAEALADGLDKFSNEWLAPAVADFANAPQEPRLQPGSGYRYAEYISTPAPLAE